MQLEGQFWITHNGKNLAGQSRIELLTQIASSGSITQAAKAFGMSYKAALAGDCLLAQAPTPLQESFIQRFQALEIWEQGLLLSSLQRISAMMNADGIDAAPVLSVRPLTEERA